MKQDSTLEIDDKKDKPVDNLAGSELSWTAPRRGTKDTVHRTFLILRTIGLRSLVVPAILIFGFYLLSRYLVGPLEVEGGIFRVLFGLLGILGYIFFFTVFHELCPDQYKMNDEGIEIRSSTSSEGNKMTPWHKIRSFYLERKPDGENADLLVLYLDRGRKVLWLPEDELKDTILTIVKDKVPCQETVSRKRSDPVISDWAADFLWFFVGVYAVAAGYFLGTVPVFPSLQFWLVIGGTVLLGPGTIGCFLLYGRSLWRPHIRLTAGLLNFVAVCLVFMMAILFWIHHTLQMAKGAV